MSQLLPYETIVKASEGDPEAVAAVLSHYAGYVRSCAKMDGQINTCLLYTSAPYGRCGADERGMAMVSLYPIWKADNYPGQSRRGQDLLCHAPCGGLDQSKAFARSVSYTHLYVDSEYQR